MNVIGFGTYDRDKHPRAAILLDGLAQLGVQVRELNEPLGFSTADRVAMLGRPWLGYRFVLRLLRCWLHLTRARFGIRRADRPDAVVVGYLGHFDVVLARLLFPRTVIVLDLLIFAADTALDRGVRAGPKPRLLAALDRLAIRCSDLVVVDTEEHAAMVPPSQREKVVVVAVGSPDHWFRKPPADRGTGPLRVVFYGMFTPLQGAPVIGAALAGLAPGTDIEVTMIGSGQDLAETRVRAAAGRAGTVSAGRAGAELGPVVRWREWIAPADLPAVVADHDVCLGIFSTTAKGLRVTPNKVYQGAAAGCAIVTSDTAPQRRALGDAAHYVPAGDAAALTKILERLAGDPPEVTALRSAAYARAEQAFRPAQVSRPLREAIVAALSQPAA